MARHLNLPSMPDAEPGDWRPNFTYDDPESWRPIGDFEYEISSHGRVRRRTESPHNKIEKGKILKPYINRGYHQIDLWRDGKNHHFMVHALVCRMFNGPRPSDIFETRHLDGSRANNWPANLVWGTPKENSDDIDRHGRRRRGATNTRAKLTQTQVDELRTWYASASADRGRAPDGSVKNRAAEYRVSTKTITDICKNRIYLPSLPAVAVSP